MKTLLKIFHTKPLSACLTAVLLALSIFTGPAEAMFIPAAPQQDPASAAAVSTDRAANLARIQAVLESKIIQQKLLDYGLSPEEAMARVSRLSDGQINQLATHTDSLQAAGRSGHLLVILLLIILIVLLV